MLATCGRTEVYLVAERFHAAFADVTEFLAAVAGMSVDELHPYLLALHDEAAATHLFEVAAGLDSLVLGESEILGQVRAAWRTARANDAVRTTLDLLFRHALHTGKRVRTETAIGRGTASISHAAVELATDRLGSLVGRSVLVVGAGDMGAGVATSLRKAGAKDITVANRTPERGRALAAKVGAAVVGFDDLGDALGRCDVVVTCVAGTESPITADLLARRGGELLVVDIALPRNVDRAAASLAGVTVLDLDDVSAWAQRGRAARSAEAGPARDIIAEQLDRFLLDSTARQAAPLVARLHEHADEIRSSEIERFSSRLGALSDEHRDAVEALTRSIVAKLLHSAVGAPAPRRRHPTRRAQRRRRHRAVRACNRWRARRPLR